MYVLWVSCMEWVSMSEWDGYSWEGNEKTEVHNYDKSFVLEVNTDDDWRNFIMFVSFV